MITLLLPVLAYLVGSISSAIIISKLKGLDDPRTIGSGNPGATNVLRSGDKSAAALTLVGDILKGLIPVLLAKMLGATPFLVALVGLGAFLGHLYPIYYQFKGGKGVATAGGVLIGLNPFIVLILIGIWLVIAIVTRYSSLAALIAALAAPLLFALIAPSLPTFLLASIIAILLTWRHRANIKRLLDGTESKINFRKQR